MDYSCLQLETRDAVATVTLQRPEVHNAFDDRLIAELTQCYRHLEDEAAVRVIVLRGAGRSFCAGADLNWMRRMTDYSHEENIADARALQRMFAAIAASPKVTVAAVHGAAIGGGVGLVAACDIAIAGFAATFALSEVRLGLVPAVIAPYVVERIGPHAARALFLTGQRIDGDAALRLGLVDETVPSALIDFDRAVAERVETLLAAGPVAVATVKSLLRSIAGQTPAEAAEATVECIAALRAGPEAQEGMRAFLEKRRPNWSVTP
jgi:methylglutaconyl-CoA hydratase